MASTFSCTTELSLSYWRSICLKSLAALLMRMASAAERKTMATRKMSDSLPFIIRHIMNENTRFRGALNEVRSSIWVAFWILETSVVMRVTRPAVLYLSMSLKEKRWMLRYIASRRLAARPVLPKAAKRAARTPNRRLRSARATIIPPYL